MTTDKTKKGASSSAAKAFIDFDKEWKRLEGHWEAGVVVALYDALILARDSGRNPPEWVLEGARKVVEDRLKQGFSQGKGQLGNELSKHRSRMVKYSRYQCVKKHRSDGMTIEDACVAAEKQLKSTSAAASEGQMKKDFYKVQSELKDEKLAALYYRGRFDGAYLMDA